MPTPRRIIDAVVVVPGVLGSELADTDGTVWWGQKPTWSRSSLARLYEKLTLSDGEVAGTPLLRPTRLITRTALLSGFAIQSPYTRLVRDLRATAMDPRAVGLFPYDWRLSLTHNAGLLRTMALAHLSRWRQILADLRATGDREVARLDPDEIRLSFVAHATGGPLVRHACRDEPLRSSTRQVVALGPPYRGTARAVDLFNAGTSDLADEQAVGALAVSCPGAYDLLPRERCVHDQGSWRELSGDDVVAMGGRRELADQAAARTQAADPSGPRTTALSGYTIPTGWAVRSDAGRWTVENRTAEGTDALGDGLVTFDPAPADLKVEPLVASHGHLPDSLAGVRTTTLLLLGYTDPPRARPTRRELGLTVPVTASPGGVTVEVSQPGVELTSRDRIRVTSRREYQADKWYRPQTWTPEPAREGRLTFRTALRPGLYRVSAHADDDEVVTAMLTVLSRA